MDDEEPEDELELIDSSRSQNFQDELSQISKMHSQKLLKKIFKTESGQMDELQNKYK